MTPKEFAEKYVGKVAIYTGRDFKDTTGIVVGYDERRVFLASVKRLYQGRRMAELPTQLPAGCIALVKLPPEIIWGGYSVQGLQLVEPIEIKFGPDDCLDCGAKGEEKCKPNCPNAGE